jgi:TonB family protein
VSPGKGFPNADDFYPATSQRLGESGSVNVRACVGTDGALTTEPTIDKTSGSPRLDEGALRLAQAGSGKYMPATENGKRVASCFVFRVTFVLRGPAETVPSADTEATENPPAPGAQPDGGAGGPHGTEP